MAYLCFSQFESSFLVDRQQLFLEQELLPAELIAKCAAFSVKPTAITDLKQAMNGELLGNRNEPPVIFYCAAILIMHTIQLQLN